MNFSIEAKIPPHAPFASLVHAFVEDAAWRAELHSTQREAIVRCSSAAFEQIVCDCMAEAAEPIRVVAECTPEQLRVSLFERGLPMDEALARRNGHWTRITAEVDEAHWHVHGKQGPEFQFAVTRPVNALAEPTVARPSQST